MSNDHEASKKKKKRRYRELNRKVFKLGRIIGYGLPIDQKNITLSLLPVI